MTIKQGEVWLVEFFPKVGSEIAKTRQAVVISDDRIGRLPLKTIVPVTDHKPAYDAYPWMLKLEPTGANGLNKPSSADCFQVKNFSDDQFIKKLGDLSTKTVREIHRLVLKTLNPAYKIEG